MVRVSYVYPNISKRRKKYGPPRGGLLERWQAAVEFGCEYIEVPADFIKDRGSPSEDQLTGLKPGAILTEAAIEALYKRDYGVPSELKYILHTDPQLEPHHKLEWNNETWRKSLADMVKDISIYFGKPPSIIEIHPGTGSKNPFTDITKASRLLQDAFRQVEGFEPHVLVENRTDQQISSGREIRGFWSFLSKENLALKSKIGVILDIQQLYSQNRNNLKRRLGEASDSMLSMNFEQDLNAIPQEVLGGFHIHRLHSVPNLSNEIPWRFVFERIASIKNSIIINPEVHHAGDVKKTIDFCELMLHSRQS